MVITYTNLKVSRFYIPEISGIKLSSLKNHRSIIVSNESGEIYAEFYYAAPKDFKDINEVGNVVNLTIAPDEAGNQYRFLCSEVNGKQVTFIRPIGPPYSMMTKATIRLREYEIKNCGFKFEVGKCYNIDLKKVSDTIEIGNCDEWEDED